MHYNANWTICTYAIHNKISTVRFKFTIIFIELSILQNDKSLSGTKLIVL